MGRLCSFPDNKCNCVCVILPAKVKLPRIAKYLKYVATSSVTHDPAVFMMQETPAGIVNTSTAVTQMYVDKLSWFQCFYDTAFLN